MDLSEFNKYFTDFHNNGDQQIIFISIGSASNIESKLNNTIDDKDMHQYPPYIRYVVGVANLPIHILLIDPALEQCPYIIENNVINREQNITYYKNNTYDNIWYSGDEENKVNIYCFNQYVYYMEKGDPINNSFGSERIHINQQLKELNNICIEGGHLLFFHDFSGRDTYLLAMEFDDMLNNDRNHILYDISNRSLGSCSIDLTDKGNYYKIEKYDNSKYHIINPFINPNKEIMKAYYESSDNVYKNQLMEIMVRNINNVNVHIYYIYRRVNTILNSDINDSRRIIDSIRYREFEYLDIKYKLDLYEMFLGCGYDLVKIMELKDILYSILESELKVIIENVDYGEDEHIIVAKVDSFMHKIDKEEYKYNWYNHFKEYIKSKKIDL